MKKPTFILAAQALLTLILIASDFAQAAPASKPPKSPVKAPRVLSTPAVSKAAPNTALESATISKGEKTDLKQFLMPERPTVFAFYKPSQRLEQDLVSQLQKQAGTQIGFQLVQLKTGTEPIAQQYQIQETPMMLVFDRRGRLVGRSGKVEEIRGFVGQALQVMRIDWAAEGDPRLDKTREMLGGQKNVPGILRTMSLRPDYLQGFMAMSMRAQFTDGFIDRRTKELIATYVSAINKCKY